MFTADDQLQAAVDDLLGAPRDADKAAPQGRPAVRHPRAVPHAHRRLRHARRLPPRPRPARHHRRLHRPGQERPQQDRGQQVGRVGPRRLQLVGADRHRRALQQPPIHHRHPGRHGRQPARRRRGRRVHRAGHRRFSPRPPPSSSTAATSRSPSSSSTATKPASSPPTRASWPSPACARSPRWSPPSSPPTPASAPPWPTPAPSSTPPPLTTAGGHANLLTTALAAAEWEVVSAAMYNQPLLVKTGAGYYGTGPKMAINPRYLLVPRALQLTGKQILYPGWERAANITAENLQHGPARRRDHRPRMDRRHRLGRRHAIRPSPPPSSSASASASCPRSSSPATTRAPPSS